MSELSKRMREIASKATVAPSQGPEVCTMHAVDFDDQPKYWRCALGDGVLSLCAEIEDLEKEVETLRRGPTTIMGLSLAEIHELINESFTRRREFKSLRIKDHRK